MCSNHPEKVASKCEHSIHPSSSSHTPWCPQCTISRAHTDLEQARKALIAGGGPNAPTHILNHVWNVARLRCAVMTSKVNRMMRDDKLRREREQAWEKAHQQNLIRSGSLPRDDLFQALCVVCATTKELGRSYAKPIMFLKTAWWEREDALVDDEVLVPRTPRRPKTSKKCPSRLRATQPSYLRNLILSYREIRTVSDGQRRAWEDRCKLDRTLRRKYNLTDDFGIDPELLAFPMPASQARRHHRQLQDNLKASGRRANRQKRRVESYKPSRSSLALSELAEDVIMDGTELERVRLAEEAVKLRWQTSVIATEVGYLYFVGGIGLLEHWRDDVEQSNLSLIYRKYEKGLETVELDGCHVAAEADEEL